MNATPKTTGPALGEIAGVIFPGSTAGASSRSSNTSISRSRVKLQRYRTAVAFAAIGMANDVRAGLVDRQHELVAQLRARYDCSSSVVAQRARARRASAGLGRKLAVPAGYAQPRLHPAPATAAPSCRRPVRRCLRSPTSARRRGSGAKPAWRGIRSRMPALPSVFPLGVTYIGGAVGEQIQRRRLPSSIALSP